MRRLEITNEMIDEHLSAYDEGILRGLEELANGRPILKLDGRKKECKPCDKNMIDPSDDENSWERLYLICAFALYQEGKTTTSILLQTPQELQDTVTWLRNIEEYIVQKFGRNSKEYISWKSGKEKVKCLVNYDEFSLGNGLCVKVDKNKRPLFHWERLQKWGGWCFLKLLNVGACSYCNSDGVFAIKYLSSESDVGPKHRKSEIDHFWPRSDFPLLGLSLYNLVPSCTRCNRNVKSNEYLPLAEYAHPYLDDYFRGAKFYAVFKDYKGITQPNETNVDIIVRPPGESHDASLAKRATKSAGFFHLEEVYNQIYELEVKDVVRKVLYMPETYLEDLRRHYPGIEESVLNRMVLGSSMNPDDINKLPHEKLRQDIHDQLWLQR